MLKRIPLLNRLVGASGGPGRVNVLRLHGVISPTKSNGPLGGGGPVLNLETLAADIEKTFKPANLSAVALLINSPGGSPVQSNLIAARIRQLADEKGVPVIAFTEDVAASGGYWLACAADEIVADPASIVGSIGVISGGFGFTGLMERLGVERRLYTAGENKSRLDPFSAEKDSDVEWIKSLQLDLHEIFRRFVELRRGDKFKTEDPRSLMNGDVFLGERALELGMVDSVGDMRSTLRARFGDAVQIKLVNKPKRGLPLLGLLGSRSGGDPLASALSSLENRALWGQYGL
ncbi:MAG: S49 family peptidase [Geminicoccus sp.]|nr:S49 family peptidase [Geminicoccus sp.]